MDMLRTLRFGLLLALSSIAASSCLSPPDFPDTPSIEFKSLKVTREPVQLVDTVTVTISFKDGDGDLGLNSEEYSNPPYNRLNSDGTFNLNHWNYFCKIFVKNKSNNQFEPLTLQANNIVVKPESYYSQFPHLEPENFEKEAPLKGDLNFVQAFGLGNEFLPGDEVRFEIYIKDRALNTSNTVTTSSFIIQPR